MQSFNGKNDKLEHCKSTASDKNNSEVQNH